jgi:hypothetical protein
MVFENRELRRAFGPGREKETGGQRQLYHEELQNLCSSPQIMRLDKAESKRRMRA